MIIGIVLFCILLIILVINALDVTGGIIYYFGNRIAQYFGLQDKPRPHASISEIAKVIETSSERLRVEYQGTTWFARAKDGLGSFVNGDNVKVIGRDGLTLLVERVG